MAESSASASTSTSNAVNSNYDVFISHRGPDVKKTFASHLYRRLLSYGLRAFLDQPELQRGDYLIPQIENAIRSASVHVAIFSAGYADSVWCLNELVQMLDSKAPIIPVFYDVKPTELRWTRGRKTRYAEALVNLERKTDYDLQTPRYKSSTIENWRNALSKVADISGFELEACCGDEGELVDQVVEGVLKWVKKTVLDVAKYPTGLDDKVNDFQNRVLLQRQQSRKPQILGIVGLGGIGKTTLAKEIFNRKSSDYSRSCFLFDVRDYADKGSLNLLQMELLKTLTGWGKPILSVHEGIAIFKKHISSSNTLIILDDVDKAEQVYALLPDPKVFDSDSLILITSRNKDVLVSSGVEESSIYNLTGLSTQHSLELFCLYSFNWPHPPPEFEHLVTKFVEACVGLPLSLKVIGALLNGKDTSYWEDQLIKLRNILPDEIKRKLQISYDSLDREEKQIFLDIACFFNGEDRDMALKIWDGSGWSALSGFRNIQNKCLVEVNSEKKIKIHDHLRDLGREIASASLPRRHWRPTEKINDLLQQSSVENEVRGIRIFDHEDSESDDDSSEMPWYQRSGELFVNCVMNLCNMPRNRQYSFHGTSLCMSKLQLLDGENSLVERILAKVQYPNLIWLRWNNCPYSSLRSSISMKNLRVLQVQGSKLKTLWEKESQAPSKLRELEIQAPLSSIPKSIGKLKHLQRIVIGPATEYSFEEDKVNLTKLPEEFCLMQSLKALDLRRCSEMKSLPESFGNLTNLQHIVLTKCNKLDTLPDSFGNLNNLQQIELFECQALKRLPNSFGKLNNLQQIQLITCQAFESLPDSFGNLTKLQQIQLSNFPALKSLPESFGNLTNLLQIKLSWCRSLERLPDSFGKLIKLQHLDLDSCTNLTMSSETLGNISTLEYINLSNCGKIEVFPPQVAHQRSLKMLYMRGTILKELPSEIGELSDLEVLDVGPSLDTLPSSLCNLKNLKKLQLYVCKGLKCLPVLLGDLKNLKELQLHKCKELACLPPSLGELAQLTELRVIDCPLICELPFKEVKGETLSDLDSSIHYCILPRLQLLEVAGIGISEVSFAEGVCFNLRDLKVSYCNNVEEVGTLPTTLVNLSLKLCDSLTKIDTICHLPKLQKLEIVSCKKLEELPCMESLLSLRYLNTSGCVRLKSIGGLGQLSQLQQLSVSGCSELQEVEDIQHCMSLQNLYVGDCPKLQQTVLNMSGVRWRLINK